MGFLNYFNKNFKRKEDTNSINKIDIKYKKSWNYDLMSLLKNGKSEQLDDILNLFSPLIAINEDYTTLILFRYFQVEFIENKRNVLNCHPENNNFQCGITIVKLLEDGAITMSNVYLPNNIDYKLIKNQKDEVEIFTNDNNIVKTNVSELSQKLWLKFSESEIETGFKDLCNEKYELPKKNRVKNKTIPLNSLTELVYNEDFEWYEGKIEINKKNVELSIQYCSPKKLEKVLSFINDFLISNSIPKILFEMSEKMTELKNENWLDIDENTGKEEEKINSEEFRNRIYIESIVFQDDCSSTIYCCDDTIFWGHTIEINVDKKGNFIDANLVG